MSDSCPHCGVQLSATRDAFCAECRQPLDERPAAYQSIQAGDARPSITHSAIAGAESLNWDELDNEIGRGGRLVVYQYCISIGVMTFLRSSKIHLVRGGESAFVKGLPYTLLSLAAGWWGFPWGFIYTPMAIGKNLGGGTDVTDTVVGHLR